LKIYSNLWEGPQRLDDVREHLNATDVTKSGHAVIPLLLSVTGQSGAVRDTPEGMRTSPGTGGVTKTRIRIQK
jgi:hypothetical protein